MDWRPVSGVFPVFLLLCTRICSSRCLWHCSGPKGVRWWMHEWIGICSGKKNLSIRCMYPSVKPQLIMLLSKRCILFSNCCFLCWSVIFHQNVPYFPVCQQVLEVNKKPVGEVWGNSLSVWSDPTGGIQALRSAFSISETPHMQTQYTCPQALAKSQPSLIIISFFKPEFLLQFLLSRCTVTSRGTTGERLDADIRNVMVMILALQNIVFSNAAIIHLTQTLLFPLIFLFCSPCVGTSSVRNFKKWKMQLKITWLLCLI